MKKATNNNFKKVSVNAIIEKYALDSARNVKNAPTNNAIIEMLENTSLEYLQVETSRSGSIFNRGSVVECVVRNVCNEFLNGKSATTYKKSVSDEDFTTYKKNIDLVKELGLQPNKKYEIKLITSLARASYSGAIDSDIIIVDLRAKTYGVYLVKPSDIVIYNKGGQLGIKDYNNAKNLSLLEELLGM